MFQNVQINFLTLTPKPPSKWGKILSSPSTQQIYTVTAPIIVLALLLLAFHLFFSVPKAQILLLVVLEQASA